MADMIVKDDSTVEYIDVAQVVLDRAKDYASTLIPDELKN